MQQTLRHQPVVQGPSSDQSDKYSTGKFPVHHQFSTTIYSIMGQRQQFYAIAKVGNRYRTVAVVHNQWLFGHFAVRQCLNAMRILSAPRNLAGIRRELKSANSKPDSFWEAKPEHEDDEEGRVSCSGVGVVFLY
jgi:hypothetical protein